MWATRYKQSVKNRKVLSMNLKNCLKNPKLKKKRPDGYSFRYRWTLIEWNQVKYPKQHLLFFILFPSVIIHAKFSTTQLEFWWHKNLSWFTLWVGSRYNSILDLRLKILASAISIAVFICANFRIFYTLCACVCALIFPNNHINLGFT